MTEAMKNWIHDRGLTAMTVARAAGIESRHVLYRMLCRQIPVSKSLYDALTGIYGMTDAEFEEVIPWTGSRSASRKFIR